MKKLQDIVKKKEKMKMKGNRNLIIPAYVRMHTRQPNLPKDKKENAIKLRIKHRKGVFSVVAPLGVPSTAHVSKPG
jgi:hypothetical protein